MVNNTSEPKTARSLANARILVVEDDSIIALDIDQVLASQGATVLGPAHSVAQALPLAETEQIDVAVLDFRLEQADALPIARRLSERGIPYLYQTSDKASIPEEHRTAPILKKPISEARLITALTHLLTKGRPASGAIVEPPRSREPASREISESGLQNRIRQQELLAELGVLALQRIPIPDLLQRAAEIASEGLGAELAKVLEYLPGDNRLLLRAGVGWDPGLIGVATVGADLESPAGYALQTGRAVISNHLAGEQRFRTPELLSDHGVRRAMNVILQGEGAPFGILEVDSRTPGEFTEHDISFLQGAANVLGMAIERDRTDKQLRAALTYQTVLVKEINHRVKNSLQLVASVLDLQARASDDESIISILRDATSRMRAIARAHERLYRGTDISKIDLVAYLSDVCGDLAEFVPDCRLVCSKEESFDISTDRAVRVALVVTELVTNAAKHAFPDKSGKGKVEVEMSRESPEAMLVSVSDDGQGLLEKFEFQTSKGLGARLVMSLASQLGATLRIERPRRGTKFVVRVPLEEPSPG